MPFFRRGTLPDHYSGPAIDRTKRELSLHGILRVWSETRGRSRADAPRTTASGVQGEWMDIIEALRSGGRDFEAFVPSSSMIKKVEVSDG